MTTKQFIEALQMLDPEGRMKLYFQSHGNGNLHRVIYIDQVQACRMFDRDGNICDMGQSLEIIAHIGEEEF
jgi:hypothetical protein